MDTAAHLPIVNQMQELASTWLKPATALTLSKSGDQTECSLGPESSHSAGCAGDFRHQTEHLILVYQHVTDSQRSPLPFPKVGSSKNLQEGNNWESIISHREQT